MSNSSLKNKAVKGVGWSFADNIANSGITFLVGLILARILSPSEFGIIGMITIFIALSNSIIDSGFSNALIRKMDAEHQDYNTVFYFNLISGIILYILLYCSAPFISIFFNEPILRNVLRLLGLVLIINSLAIIQRTLLIKSVNFKTQTKVSLISSILSGILGIGMALYGGGVWSLVIQQISRQFFQTLFLWLFNSWRPYWEFSWKSFKDLFGFGSKLLLSGVIDTTYKNVYYIVIGKFYTSFQLGQYTRAEQFNTIFSNNLTSIVQRVSFPVLSSIQNEPIKLKAAYRKIIKVTMFITFTCMLGLAAIAKPLILVLIGEKWTESIGYLQIICFAGMLYPLHAINLNILQVKGRSDLFLKLEIIKKIIAIIPITLGIFLGIKFMLIGSVFISFLAYFLNSFYSSSLIDYSMKSQMRDILPTFLISICIATVIWGISFIAISYWLMLLIQLFTGVILTLLIYEKFKIDEYLECKKILASIIMKKRIYE